MTSIDRRTALRGIGALGLCGATGPTATPVRSVPTFGDGRVVDLVIDGAWVWLGDGSESVVTGRAVRVAGERIVEVRRGGIAGGTHLDLTGHLLLPGLISGHTHVAGGSSTRGLIEGGRSYARPLEIVDGELDDEALDALTAYNLAELVRSGCTSQVEMSLSLRQARSYARVADRLGSRGWVAGMVPSIGRLFPIWFGDDEALVASEDDTLEEIEANLGFARTLQVGGSRVRGMMTPHAADTQTPRTLEAFAAAAAELETGIHTHLSQGTRETETILRRYGVTPTRWLASHGLLDGPFFGAHFTAPDWDVDPELITEAGGVYVTCPSAGGAGGATQPFPEALAAGMLVNVGIDTHSNDMIENLKLAVILGQARASLVDASGNGRPVRPPSMADAVSGCTRIAADALRRPDLGRIEEGATADLTAIDLRGLLVGSGAAPPEPLNNLLYANGLAVSTVLTDGRLQVMDGVLVVEDARRIVEEGGRVVRRIWGTLEGEGWFR